MHIPRKYKTVDWETLATGYLKGDTNTELAVKLGRHFPLEKDSTKCLRSLLSTLLKSGYNNSKGQHITINKRTTINN